jgi:tetratricopeptide (TPR) repeat protein
MGLQMAKVNQKNKGNVILEDPNALVDTIQKSEEFVKKNKNILFYVIGGLIVIVGGFLYYRMNLKEENTQSQVSMINGVYSWEADSLKQALKEGLVDIADESGSTEAGNLSKFYVGTAYLKQGKFEDAIKYLKDFSSKDLLLQARVYALIGDAYMELKDTDNAIENYNKAVDYKPNVYFTPQYCMKAALAYETNKDYNSAVKMYDKIIKDFSAATELMDAKKYKARAEGLALAEQK